MLAIAGSEPVLTPDGVDLADGTYRPTAVLDEGIADKLGIHLAYLRKLRAQAIDLYDANVNGWLDRADPARKFLVRCFRGQDGSGVARALLSDGYQADRSPGRADRDHGRRPPRPAWTCGFKGCDLTERRMYVRLYSEQVSAMALALLAATGPRSPGPRARRTRWCGAAW